MPPLTLLNQETRVTLLSKAQFSRELNVGKSRVTAYLKTKLIDGDAVVGEGRHARIDLEKARAQLRDRLSINHRFGLQGLNTKLDDAPTRQPEMDDDIWIEADIAYAQLRKSLGVVERLGVNNEVTDGRIPGAGDLTAETQAFAASIAAKRLVTQEEAFNVLKSLLEPEHRA
jgi:hypothetical protein